MPLELVTHFKYLGITLTRDGSMHTAAEKMADYFRSAMARVYRTDDGKGIKHTKKSQTVAFPGLRFDSWSVCCQVWATSYLQMIPQKPPRLISYILIS